MLHRRAKTEATARHLNQGEQDGGGNRVLGKPYEHVTVPFRFDAAPKDIGFSTNHAVIESRNTLS